jgi:5'(3')-deoxyribonucleotidase|tara:strand:+ start:2302 stop:2853 length:552 start_codon:yes stop_codon:yes gene_type:complete
MQKIGIDLDGVVFNALRQARHDFGMTHKPMFDLHSYDLTEFLETDRETIKTYFEVGGVYRKMDLMPGAKEVLRTLHRAGYVMQYVTHRPPTDEVMTATLESITRHDIPAVGVSFVPDKVPLYRMGNYEFIIDDDPRVVNEVHDTVNKAFLMWPYGKLDDEVSGWVRRVTNWHDTLQEIKFYGG